MFTTQQSEAGECHEFRISLNTYEMMGNHMGEKRERL